MNPDWRISRLVDHPAARGPLAQVMRTLWSEYYGPDPATARGDADTDLADRSRAAGLPLGLVALSQVDDRPVGMAALAATSHGSRAGEEPWIVGLLTLPEWRGQGIGSALVAGLEAEAATQGFQRIYCTTASVTALLERRGWRVIRDTDDGGHQVLRLTLYRK